MGYYRKVDTAQNYALWSEDFTNAVWTKRGAHTVQSDQAVAPDGTMTADQVTVSGGLVNGTGVYDEGTGFGNGQWVFSLWLKAGTNTDAWVIIKDRASDTIRGSTKAALTSKWQRFSVTGLTAGGSTGARWEFEGDEGTFFAWGAQVEPGRYPTSYRKTTTVGVTDSVRRDNHWHKDHNGIWRRTLRIEDPTATNLVQYSAGPFNESPGGLDFWDSIWNLDSWENVASCIEGGRAIKADSTTDGAVRFNHRPTTTPTYSGNVEVVSGIFERVGQDTGAPFLGCWGEPSATHYINMGLSNWTEPLTSYANAFGNAVIVDHGVEDLGIGPNGGQLVRLWLAYDSSIVEYSGEPRYVQWRLVNIFSGVNTGILHHAQLETSSIEVPSSPIVTAGASGTRNWELLMLPWPHVPQVQTVYARWTARNIQDGTGLWQMGGGGGISRLMLVNSGSGTSLSAYMWDADANPVASSANMGTLSWDTEYEAVCQLYSDASVQIHATADGGSVVSGSRSSAPASGMPSAWESEWVHFTAPGTSNGPVDLISFKVAKGIQTLEFMRGYKETGTREY